MQSKSCLWQSVLSIPRSDIFSVDNSNHNNIVHAIMFKQTYIGFRSKQYARSAGGERWPGAAAFNSWLQLCVHS